jgi:hypothetical protein
MSGLGILTSSFVTYMPFYFLTHNLIFGFGLALLIGSTLSILSHYFRDELGFANNLINFGVAVLPISLPIITKYALKDLDLVQRFYILSALSFTSILCAFTYKPIIPQGDTSLPIFSRIKNSFGATLCKKQKFIFWGVACAYSRCCAFSVVWMLVIKC